MLNKGLRSSHRSAVWRTSVRTGGTRIRERPPCSVSSSLSESMRRRKRSCACYTSRHRSSEHDRSGQIRRRRMAVKTINWKILNLSFWIEVVLSYVLPFQTTDNFQYKIGFPIPFLSIYDAAIGVNPLMSMSLNPLGLLLNGIIIYWVISFSSGAYQKLKHKRIKS